MTENRHSKPSRADQLRGVDPASSTSFSTEAASAPTLRDKFRRPKDVEKRKRERLIVRVFAKLSERFANGGQRRADGVPFGYKLIEPTAERIDAADFDKIESPLTGPEHTGEIQWHEPIGAQAPDKAKVLVFPRFEVGTKTPPDAEDPRVYKKRLSGNKFQIAATQGTELLVDLEGDGGMQVTVPEGTKVVNDLEGGGERKVIVPEGTKIVMNPDGINRIVISKDLWRAPKAKKQ